MDMNGAYEEEVRYQCPLVEIVFDLFHVVAESAAFVAPIKHAEATFHRPMRPGHQYDVELSVTKIGESSFEVRTTFVDRAGAAPVLCAEARIVKAFADPATWKKMPIPSAIRARLLPHLAGE